MQKIITVVMVTFHRDFLPDSPHYWPWHHGLLPLANNCHDYDLSSACVVLDSHYRHTWKLPVSLQINGNLNIPPVPSLMLLLNKAAIFSISHYCNYCDNPSMIIQFGQVSLTGRKANSGSVWCEVIWSGTDKLRYIIWNKVGSICKTLSPCA